MEPTVARLRSPPPNVRVSGRVISVIFRLPQELINGDGAEDVCAGGMTTNVPLDELRYLSSNESGWGHIVVGWPGKIELRPSATDSGHTKDVSSIDAALKSGEGVNQGMESNQTKQARKRLETRWSNATGIRMIPVWLEDADTMERQSDAKGASHKSFPYAERELLGLFQSGKCPTKTCLEEKVWWADYEEMNIQFARRIMEIYRPGDIIMIHDYQLCLVPKMLRERLARAYVQFCLHLPFPNAHEMQPLIRRNEITEGMLGSNLIMFVGVQAKRNFLECCQLLLLLRYQEETVQADLVPVMLASIPHGVESQLTISLNSLLESVARSPEMQELYLLDMDQVSEAYTSAKKRLFLFDYDGTLTPIVDNPDKALPSKLLLDDLERLVSDERNAVWIVSGRRTDFLQQHLGQVKGLGFSAEHGSFVRPPGVTEWTSVAEHLDMSWQDQVLEILRQYTAQTSGSVVEQKQVALTWHYRQAEQLTAREQARKCKASLEGTVAVGHELEVMEGKCNLEVRPKSVNKGEIAKWLLEGNGHAQDAIPSKAPFEFVLCIGDDLTDEDMFRTLLTSSLPSNKAFSCSIGPGDKLTVASYYLPEPDDVIDAIGWLSKLEP